MFNPSTSKNPTTEKFEIQTLSKEFNTHCSQDAAKKCILFSKFILQGLNVWPDNKNSIRRWVIIMTVISLGIMEFGHIAYIFLNFKNISKLASASTTASTTFETMAKLVTMLYYRDALNTILVAIWHDFWPANITYPDRFSKIKGRSTYVIIIGCIFLFMAYVSCAQFMAFPLIENTDQLPLQSWFPFNFRKSPQYEILYIWQWFMNQIVITTLSGFDSFFNSIVMIFATQFQVLQDVLENACSPIKGEKQRDYLFSGENASPDEMDVLIKCVERHNLLFNLCTMVEHIFSHIVFIQFIASTLAICVSCVALMADPSVWQHMLSYAIAHILQFFIYCSVGNELIYQSGRVADAAYNSDWENSTHMGFKKGIVMIIQRAHRPEKLTVAGLMELNFTNFLATLQLSFSFYTLLNSFV